MIFQLPKAFEKFLQYNSLNIINEAVINLKKDSITSSLRNNEQTLHIYSKFKTECFSNIETEKINILNKKGEVIDTENRKDIGFVNLPLLIKSFGALYNEENVANFEILDDSIILSNNNSKYRILLCHPDIISVPGRLKLMEFPISFQLDSNTISSILKGMSVIEDINFSIEQDKEGCFVKVGVEITNNYKKNVINNKDKFLSFKKFYNKEHINAILEIHKNNIVKFEMMEQILNIHCEDKENEIVIDYFLNPKKTFSNSAE